MPPLQTELDLGAAPTSALPADDDAAFDLRSSRLAEQLDRAAATLQTAVDLLSHHAPSPAALAPHMDRLETLTAAVRRDLAALADANRAAAAARPAPGPASLRIRVTRFAKHARDFSAFLADYETAREDYRLLLDAGVRSGIADLEPGLSAAQVDDAMRRDGALDRVLEQARPELRWQVQDLRERNRHLAKLNKDVASLHEMFVELSFLTENQQELINDIEHNVQQVKTDVKKADDEIIEAHRYQKSARKKKMIIAAILLLIILIVVIVVVIQVT